jgi:O-methyltransferase
MNKIKKIIRRYGYDIVAFKTHLGEPDPLIPWETDADFIAVYDAVVNVTLVDRKKLFTLWQLALKTAKIEGQIAECGVYKGGTALLLAKTKRTNTELHLFDTFEGMPQTDPTKDQHHAGDFDDTSLESVQKLFQGLENVHFHKGFFPETAKPIMDKKFALVHCDMDIYSSVLDCCHFFYPKLVPGGAIIFDDYGAPSCPGAKKAVDEFCEEVGCYSLYLTSGQAIIIKY